jgi:hypothetical protein
MSQSFVRETNAIEYADARITPSNDLNSLCLVTLSICFFIREYITWHPRSYRINFLQTCLCTLINMTLLRAEPYMIAWSRPFNFFTSVISLKERFVFKLDFEKAFVITWNMRSFYRWWNINVFLINYGLNGSGAFFHQALLQFSWMVGGLFLCKRGLIRREDPLSPLLFVLSWQLICFSP